MRELTELYSKLVPTGMTQERLESEIACLTDFGWSCEQIFFSIGYLHRYYPDELRESLMESMVFNKSELEKYYLLALAKQEARLEEESDKKYDPSNKQRIDKPTWFRKGIDFDLFK